MPDNLRTDLDQFLAQSGQCPMLDLARQSQRSQKFSQIVGEGEQLQPDFIGPEFVAGQPRPGQSDLAFLDSLLGCSPLVVEIDHPLVPPPQVGHNESDARKQLIAIPFDLGHSKPVITVDG
jgi:hypothetical protein